MPFIESTGFISDEVTPGTQVTPPVAGDAVHYHTMQFRPNGGSKHRPIVENRVDRRVAKAPSTKWWEISFENEVKAGTAADAPPEISNFLQGAGFDETVNVSTSVVYTITQQPMANASIVSHSLRKELIGNQANPITVQAYGVRWGGFELAWAEDDEVVVRGTGIGAYVTPVAAAAVAPTYNAGAPLAELTTFTIGAWADSVVRSLSVTLPTRAVPRRGRSSNDVEGVVWPCVLSWPVGEPVRGTAQIELVDETAHGFYAAWEAGTAEDIQAVFTIGSRTLTVDLESCQYEAITKVRDEPYLYDLNFHAHYDGTNGSVKLTFA